MIKLDSITRLPVVDDEIYFYGDTLEFSNFDVDLGVFIDQAVEGRPDVFARALLGDESLADVIGEFNQIEDLLSLKIDDLLFVPFDGSWVFKNPTTEEDSTIRNKISEKISRKLPNSKRTRSFLKRGGRLTF